MGPSVITLLLDDSPLPSKESVQEVSNFLPSKDTTSTIPCERNFCVILGCLAEKLAGPAGSMSILTDKLLTYLLKNITEETPKDVMLFSLIALEKFAATGKVNSILMKNLFATLFFISCEQLKTKQPLRKSFWSLKKILF